MLRAAESACSRGPKVMMMVVVFAMVFVVLALGVVFTLMIRAHRHAVQHGSMNAAEVKHRA